MAAGQHDFTIEAGATFSRQLAWKDEDGDLIDTSGYTARMHLRRAITDATTLLELTDGDGITLGIVGSGAAAYNIKLDISSTATAALDPTHRGFRCFYDLELSGGGVVTRLLEGSVYVKAEVSR